MAFIEAIGSYLPPWGSAAKRVAGVDEDALTLAVEAGLAALAGGRVVHRVVLVTRDLPLLEGGNAAALLAGLGLDSTIMVEERVGGAPALLDAVLSARPRSLIVGVDLEPAGAGALVTGGTGMEIRPVARLVRSLPERARGQDGVLHHYDDSRLVRERGLHASLALVAEREKPIAIAGISHAQARSQTQGRPAVLPTTGASSAVFALAAASEAATTGNVYAVEQATLTGGHVDGVQVPVHRREPEPQAVPERTPAKGIDIPISLAAYDRAFDAKVRLEAARCRPCGTLSFPPRHRCLDCGSEGDTTAVPLPRRGSVYTATTIRVPVPGLPVPYSLVIVELDDVGVRVLARITDTPAGSVSVGDSGQLVLRRVAVRSGVPDYGYAFAPAQEVSA